MLRRLILPLAAVFLAACLPDATGSSDQGLVRLDLSALLATEGSVVAGQVVGARDPAFVVSRVLIRVFVVGDPRPIVERETGLGALSEDGTGNLTVTFPLPQGNESGPFEAVVELRSAAGTVLYRMGPAQFTLGPNRGGELTATAGFVGPGADVTSVRFEAPTLRLVRGASEVVRCLGARGSAGETESFPRSFTSTNPAVAAVDAAGRVTAVAAGTATVRCRLESDASATAELTVTVVSDLPGSITGVVRSATTGQPITVPATITVRAGRDVTTGAVLVTRTTGAGAAFTIPDLPEGTYTLQAVAAGFVAGVGNITVLPALSTTANVVLSPEAPPGELRIVLTWGAAPADLDAVLQLPNGQLVSWQDVGSCSSPPFACLDVDDVDGFGPETITITQQQAGTYTFVVDNFSARILNRPASDNSLATSGALVEVYRGNARLASFSVPSGPGQLWTVFTLNGATLTPVNTLSTPPPALRVGELGPKPPR